MLQNKIFVSSFFLDSQKKTKILYFSSQTACGEGMWRKIEKIWMLKSYCHKVRDSYNMRIVMETERGHRNRDYY